MPTILLTLFSDSCHYSKNMVYAQLSLCESILSIPQSLVGFQV